MSNKFRKSIDRRAFLYYLSSKNLSVLNQKKPENTEDRKQRGHTSPYPCEAQESECQHIFLYELERSNRHP